MVESETSALDRVFHALSDRTRRSILRQLSRKEQTVTELAGRYPISLAAVSKHIMVLEGAGLVGRRKEGSFRIMKLRPEPLLAAVEWMAHYQKFWAVRLDALKTLLENDQP